MGQTIACAAHGCDILVDDQTVMSVPPGPLHPVSLDLYISLLFRCFQEFSQRPQSETQVSTAHHQQFR